MTDTNNAPSEPERNEAEPDVSGNFRDHPMGDMITERYSSGF